MRIEILIGDVQVKALIDTGAERSVLCVETFRKIQRSKANSLFNDVILLTVSGEKLPMFGKFKLPLVYNGSTFQQDFVIAGGITEECIVGMDTITDLGLVIDSVDRTVFSKLRKVSDSKVPNVVCKEVEEEFENPATVVTIERLSIPAKSGVVVHCKIPKGMAELSKESNVIFEPSSNLPDGIEVEYCYLSNVSKVLPIFVINNSSKPVVVPRKTVIGEIEAVKSSARS